MPPEPPVPAELNLKVESEIDTVPVATIPPPEPPAAPLPVMKTAPWAPPAPPVRATKDEILTIAPPLPPCRVDIRRTASRAHKIVPITFTPKTRSRASVVTDSTREKPPVVAALLTSPPT